MTTTASTTNDKRSHHDHDSPRTKRRRQRQRRQSSVWVAGFGCIALVLPIAIVIQWIGIASMRSYLSPLVPSPLWNHHPRLSPNWIAYLQQKRERLLQEQQQHHHQHTTTTVSACLLVMDDNHVIPEWLAYHYATLPLRRLIVASDPRAVTSPHALLQQWKPLLNVTLWKDLDYFPKAHQKTLLLHHQHRLRQELNTEQIGNDTKKNATTESIVIQKTLTLLHRFRQKNFYATCMRQLQAEKTPQPDNNRSNWILFADSDEFVAINRPFWKYFHHYQELLTSKSTTSFPSPQSRSNNEDDPINHTPSPHIIDLSKESISSLFLRQEANHTNPLTQSPCVGLPRIQMGTQEADEKALSSTTAHLLQQMRLSRDHFLTLRYPYHGPAHSLRNKAGKGLLDVSRVEKRYMRVEETDVHRPNKRYCTNEDMWIKLRESPLTLYHHVGSLSQWMHRSDPRAGKRTVESYQPFAALNTTRVPKQLGQWIEEFVAQVGLKQATALLQGVGQIADIPTNQTITDEVFLDGLLKSFAQDSQHHRDNTSP